MSTKVTLELDIQKAKNLIKQMSLADKIKLLKELNRETWGKRIDEIIKNIDLRRKKYKVSAKEISKTIKESQKEFHARRY